jgi:phosphatidylserine decarboxylase
MRLQTLFEGRWIFAVLIALAVGSWFLFSWLIVVWALLIVFCINFFRDPDRPSSSDERDIVSPADGLVVEIEEMEEGEVVKERRRRVAIFLSVFDVHVNRTPIAARISYVKHHPGLFLDARNPECSRKNEAMTWAFEGKRATLVVRQITGAIARRIVPWSQSGDAVEKGHRFGMIRFGSRTEVYLPLDCQVLVKAGDRVKGAETIIARFS